MRQINGRRIAAAIAQAKWHDGVTGGWIRNTVCSSTQYYHVLQNHWGMVLFYNPDVPDIGVSQLPQDMLFKTRGHLYARSEWGSDATFVLFRCGRFEIDGRNNADNNSFIIWRNTYLACDTGTKWGTDPSLKENSDGRHYSLYFRQTIAHNSMTIGTSNSEDLNYTTVCGGQISRVSPEKLQMYGMPVSEDNKYSRQAGEIQAYETSPEFCYAVGDARHSYDPTVVKGFTRQFVYIRPGAIVIFDRVDAVRAQATKRWYLHTMEQPQCLDGTMTADTSVHPDGHFLANGKTLSASHGGSVLFMKNLLPEKTTIRVLGGKGHQFEVNGENYDMKDMWWEKIGTKQFQEAIGLGWWRVEVEPQEQQVNDVFLHVLWSTDVKKITKNGQVGAKFTADGNAVEVTFATSGDVAGHIKIEKKGAVLCDRPLVSKLEDNYQKWGKDPRFKDWMTNPYMRSVIGEKEQDFFKDISKKRPRKKK